MNQTEMLASLLSPTERDALTAATELYGAHAKQMAVGLIVALGLEDQTAAELAAAISDRIETINDFQERREVAGHFQALSQSLGRESTRAVSIVPVTLDVAAETTDIEMPNEELPHTTVTPAPRPSTVTEQSREVVDIAPGVQHPSVPVRRRRLGPEKYGGPAANIPELEDNHLQIRSPQANFLLSIFGKEGLLEILQYSPTEFVALRSLMSVTYQSFDMRLADPEKSRRAEQISRFLAGEEIRALADEFGKKPNTMYVNLVTGVPEMFKKRSTPEQRQALIQKAKAIAANTVEAETIVAAEAVADASINDTSDYETLANNPSINVEEPEDYDPVSKQKVLEYLGQLIYADKDTVRAISNLFDTMRRSVEYDLVSTTLREDLRLMLEFATAETAARPEQELNPLEQAVLENVFGDPEKKLPPLTLYSIRGKYSAELREQHRKIEEVATTALAKLCDIRSVQMGRSPRN